ncbi:MAG: OmpH family outer membrane protein [Acidobacteriota bacterium]
MHMTRVAAVFLCGLVLAGAAAAQAPVATAGKFVFVDVERAVVLIDEGKARLQELEEWARPRQEELAKLNGDVTNLGNELNAKRGTIPDDQLADLNRRLVARQREFEDKQRIGKREFEERQNGVLRELGRKLNDVITKYAEDSQFAVVFILKPNDVVYLARENDITDTVIKLYNETHPFATKAAGK